MPRLRRPSAPMLVALLALFVALGGPAQASRAVQAALGTGSVGTKQVKDRSLRTRDLARGTVRDLRRTPDGSVSARKLAPRAVTPGKIAPQAVGTAAIADHAVQGGDIGLGAVGSTEVADGSLTGADVADGGLDARDIARFWGRFTITVGPILGGKCWQGDPVGLAPERSGYDIAGDVIQVTPSGGWPETTPTPGSLTFTARASTTRSRFTLSLCNLTSTTVGPAPIAFNYVVLDVP